MENTDPVIPEWERELLMTMCNIYDVRIMITTINSLREQLEEKDQEILRLTNGNKSNREALHAYADAVETNPHVSTWDSKDVAFDVRDWAYYEHGVPGDE